MPVHVPAPAPIIIHQQAPQVQAPQVKIIKLVQDNAPSAGWAEQPQAQHIKIIKVVDSAQHHQSW